VGKGWVVGGGESVTSPCSSSIASSHLPLLHLLSSFLSLLLLLFIIIILYDFIIMIAP